MKLIILTGLVLAATIQIARSEELVRVTESCDKYSCSIVIHGPAVPCVLNARKKAWEAGYMAAVAIRDCMDAAASRLAAK